MSLQMKQILWVTNKFGSIGIALCENAEGKRSIRISQVPGHHEETDIGIVVDWGAKITKDMAAAMILHFAGEENQEDPDFPPGTTET